MTCLEENEVLELLEAEPDAALDAREHVRHCERCRTLVASVARVLFTNEDTEPGGWLDDAELLRPGTALGDYDIEDRVGHGGMGVVYAARDRRLQRTVALKLLRPGAHASIERLQREARLMASLNHPNIVTVYDVGESIYGGFVAMEFVDGEDLAQWLETPRTAVDILAVLRQAGEGLAAAHKAGIVHRDFKPHNVLVGADGRARVVDFGLAVSVGGGVSEPGGTIAGTPAFLAPEQIRGDDVDARTDQFSYCTVAFAALGGTRPFAGRTIGATLIEMENGRIASAPSIPKPIRTALHRGLQALPDDRFQTMAELLRAMDRRPRRWPLFAAGLLAAGAIVYGAQQPPTPHVPSVASGGLDVRNAVLARRYERLHDEIWASWASDAWDTDRDPLLSEVKALVADADAAEDSNAKGKASLLVGTAMMWTAPSPDAQYWFEQGYVAAQRASDHVTAFESSRALWRMAVTTGANEDMARRWRAAATAAAEATDDPVVWARLLVFEGTAKMRAGDYAQAIDTFDDAESYLDEGSPVQTWTEVLSQRGFARLRLEDPRGALEDFEQSMLRVDSAPHVNSGDALVTLNGLGVAQRMLGRLDDAVVSLKRLQSLVPDVPGNPDVAAIRGNLAQIYSDQGRYALALAEFEAVREVFEAFHGPSHPDVSRTSAGIASMLYQLERYEDARREAEEALRWDVPEHLLVSVRLVWAASHGKLGNVDEAATKLEAIIADPKAKDLERDEARDVLTSLRRRSPP